MARRPLLTSIALAVVFSASVLVALSQAGQERAARPQDQVSQLLERVEKLEARVAELERSTPHVIVQQHGDPALRVLPDGLPGGPVPKGWQRKEFNGQWYYDIPLGSR
jgi:hypothetical protein